MCAWGSDWNWKLLLYEVCEVDITRYVVMCRYFIWIHILQLSNSQFQFILWYNKVLRTYSERSGSFSAGLETIGATFDGCLQCLAGSRGTNEFLSGVVDRENSWT